MEASADLGGLEASEGAEWLTHANGSRRAGEEAKRSGAR